jgi:hypothetical protein
MGNTTTHIQYTTSNNSSTPRPSTPPARAGVAQRRRAFQTAAAVRRRRAGRHQSVGAVGLAAYGLLCAHAQRLALVRPAVSGCFGSGASAGLQRPSVDTAREMAQAHGLATGGDDGARACGAGVGEGARSVSAAAVGRAGVLCNRGAGTSQAREAGEVARADGVLGSRGSGWHGRVAVACVAGGVAVEVVAAVGDGGGVSVDEEWVWAG